jgi:hypothetical protein
MTPMSHSVAVVRHVGQRPHIPLRLPRHALGDDVGAQRRSPPPTATNPVGTQTLSVAFRRILAGTQLEGRLLRDRRAAAISRHASVRASVPERQLAGPVPDFRFDASVCKKLASTHGESCANSALCRTAAAERETLVPQAKQDSYSLLGVLGR